VDLEFTEDQEELRATVRAFLERECPIALVRRVVEDDTPVDDLWAHMVELGWPALTVPEEAGGLGLGLVELAVVVEELGRVVAPGPFLATVTQFVPAVREAGTPEQQARFLGAVAAGEITGTLAVAEESGSWDGADVGLLARADGDEWALAGTKHYVTDGATADEIVVAARTTDSGDDDGIGLFVVPRSAVSSTRITTIDGSRQHATVDLDGVRVGADRVLGGVPGSAGIALRRALGEATVALALETVGACQSIFDVALDHARTREQFGVPIGSFQAVKHKFADMFVALEKARATCYYAALTIAEDDPARSLATSMAKAAAGDCQRLLAQEGIQVMGGMGYTWEHDMHLYVKRAKSGDALLGTAATHRAKVADLLGI
jgi:alkylation response protein AidB-like acyl-CoA dehydrogenase